MITHVATRGGPVLVRHSNRYQDRFGDYQSCSGRWVVIPVKRGQDWELKMHQVRGRTQPVRVLRKLTQQWLENGGGPS